MSFSLLSETGGGGRAQITPNSPLVISGYYHERTSQTGGATHFQGRNTTTNDEVRGVLPGFWHLQPFDWEGRKVFQQGMSVEEAKMITSVVIDAAGFVSWGALEGLSQLGKIGFGFSKFGMVLTKGGSYEGAYKLYQRAMYLHSVRGAKNGTTAVMKAYNQVTGETRIFIATEANVTRMPAKWQGLLRKGEQFIADRGHAEDTIFMNLGKEWKIIEGASSRNVCRYHCIWEAGKRGLGIGGPSFGGLGNKTPHRMFWRE